MRLCEFEGCGETMPERMKMTARFCSSKCRHRARYAANPEARRATTLAWQAACRAKGNACGFEGCEAKTLGRLSLCGGHHQQQRKGQPLRQLKYRSETGFCEFEGCDRNLHSRGLCISHDRQRRRGFALSEINGNRRPDENRDAWVRFAHAAAAANARAKGAGLPGTLVTRALVTVWEDAGGESAFPLAEYGNKSGCWHFDHVIPVAARGPGSVVSNMQPRYNNQQKGTRTEDYQTLCESHELLARENAELTAMLDEITRPALRLVA